MAYSSTKIRLIILVVHINNYTIQLGAPPYAHLFNGFITPKTKKCFYYNYYDYEEAHLKLRGRQ